MSYDSNRLQAECEQNAESNWESVALDRTGWATMGSPGWLSAEGRENENMAGRSHPYRKADWAHPDSLCHSRDLS